MYKRLFSCALTALLAVTAAHAEGHLGNAAIAAPERPLALTCYRIETETLSGALMLEEIEGEAIDVSGYGDVTTAEGETWGFLTGFSGVLDGAFLSGASSTSVEGTVVDETIQWAFVDGGLVTDMGTFTNADCIGIEEEYINRVAN